MSRIDNWLVNEIWSLVDHAYQFALIEGGPGSDVRWRLSEKFRSDDPIEVLDSFAEAKESIVEAVEAISLDDEGPLFASILRAVGVIREVHSVLAVDRKDEILLDLLDLILSDWLESRHPAVACCAIILGLLDPLSVDPKAGRRLRFDRIRRLLDDPIAHLEEVYWPAVATTEPPPNGGRVGRIAERILPVLAALLRGRGLDVLNGDDLLWSEEIAPHSPGAQSPDSSLPADAAAAEEEVFRLRNRSLWIAFPTSAHTGESTVAFGVTAEGDSAQDWRVIFATRASNLAEFDIGTWSVVVDVGGNVVVAVGRWQEGGRRRQVAIASEGDASPLAATRLAGSVTAQPRELAPAAATGSRLGHISVRVFGELSANASEDDNWDVGIEVSVGTTESPCVLEVETSGADGFLTSVLPSGLRATFASTVGLSRSRGVYVDGGVGLEVTIPLNAEIGPVLLTFLTLHFGVDEDDAALSVWVALACSVVVGPLVVSIEGLGARSKVDVPEDGGGNLGPVNLTLGIKAPTGLGLAIEAPGLAGGGFLAFETDAGSYKGMLQLEVEELVSVSVFALLDTKMPDGSKGFSLLGLIFSQFGAGGIQLGFGFTLLGVGGLFGINRGFDVEALKELFRAGQLDTLCFPERPVEQAPAVFSALGAVFPIEEGHFVFGPFVKLGWGPDAMIALSLGVLVPLPVDEIVILGQLDLHLPNKRAAIVEIHADVLGVLDLAGGSFMLEAHLRDSKLLKLYPLKGGFYLLTRWSDPPEFVFSVGGFHPRFTPPSCVPPLERLSLSVLLSPIQRLEVQGYFAITSNSIQLGAHVDFYLGVGGFNIHAWLYFDALVYFSPFWFEVDVSAGIRIWKFTIRAELHLEGPNPWYVKGKVVIDLWLFDLKLSVEHRFGKAVETGLITAKIPVDLLEAELEARENWSSVGADSAVRVRSQPEKSGLLWPSQPLRVTQKRVPLGMSIVKVDEQLLATPVELKINPVGTKLIPSPDTPKQWFARGQFQDLSEHKRLTDPAFEKVDSGIELMASDDTPLTPVAQPSGFEEIEVRAESVSDNAPKIPTSAEFTLNRSAMTRLWRRHEKVA